MEEIRKNQIPDILTEMSTLTNLMLSLFSYFFKIWIQNCLHTRLPTAFYIVNVCKFLRKQCHQSITMNKEYIFAWLIKPSSLFKAWILLTHPHPIYIYIYIYIYELGLIRLFRVKSSTDPLLRPYLILTLRSELTCEFWQ